MSEFEGNAPRGSVNRWLSGLIYLIPFLMLEGLRSIAGTPAKLTEVVSRVVFTACILLLVRVGRLQKISDHTWSLTPISIGIISAGICAGLMYLLWKNTVLAWFGTVFLLGSGLILSAWLMDIKHLGWKFFGSCSLMCATGIAMAVAGQIENRFSDEEFFIFLQGTGLGVYALALFFAGERLNKYPKIGCGLKIMARLPNLKFGYIGLFVLVIAASWGALSAYQHSFYPLEAPDYPGIQATQPFLCEETSQVSMGATGADVSRRMLERVLANPNKGLPEYGFLALSTEELEWREAFKEGILAEARRAEFTRPDGSIKYGQHQASFRVYYYALIVEKYPELFSPAEKEELEAWFAEINQRTLKPGWVDWLYAVAYQKSPSGPYENQDHGAGLLALLEVSALAPDELSDKNMAYLDSQPRGWQAAFRVTDDVFTYQSEWIQNAWFQSRQDGINHTNARISYEWLLWQALPDGGWPGYNMPYGGNLVASAYLGAVLLQDGRMLWLADRALTRLEAENGWLYAQPGMELPLVLQAISPDHGSCLLYGNSGLPNQSGPLAPDKVVLRDGWAEQDRTLLINLRFTGWHRYKATNSIILFYQGEALIAEKNTGTLFTWLPEGRSLFRDKRIPRENLNGLVVTRTGFSQVLSVLTGFGGHWAQDPPYYATVEKFTTSDRSDQVLIRMDDWHGWDSWRQVTLYDSGPVVILDQATGPKNGEAALVWQIGSENTGDYERFMLRNDAEPVELVFVPYGSWADDGTTKLQSETDDPYSTLLVETRDGEICLATVILSGSWVGAQLHIVQTVSGSGLEVRSQAETIIQPLSFDCANGDT